MKKYVEAAKEIYHYCSLETFMSIIKNQELWASDIQKMNDSTEETYLYTIFQEKVKELRKELNKVRKYREYLEDKETLFVEQGPQKRREQLSEYRKLKLGIEKFASWELLMKIHKRLLINEMLKKYDQEIGRYICCFSKNKDLLSQWRAYGDDGKGIAIGFNPRKLQEIFSREIELKDVEYIASVTKTKKLRDYLDYFPKVEYIENDAELDDIIEDACFSPEIKEMNLDMTPLLRIILAKIYAKIEKIFNLQHEQLEIQKLKNFTKLKNAHFQEEDESRIIIIEQEPYCDLRLNQEKNNLIRYKKLKGRSKLDFIDAISSIVIGPKNGITENELRHYLLLLSGMIENPKSPDTNQSEGSSEIKQKIEEKIKAIKIIKSRIPYR